MSKELSEMTNEELWQLFPIILSEHKPIWKVKQEREGDIANIMKRINVSYVFYFNKKYKKSGHLFQDRYKSEKIENDSYLLMATRYIHKNPVKAGQ